MLINYHVFRNQQVYQSLFIIKQFIVARLRAYLIAETIARDILVKNTFNAVLILQVQ